MPVLDTIQPGGGLADSFNYLAGAWLDAPVRYNIYVSPYSLVPLGAGNAGGGRA